MNFERYETPKKYPSLSDAEALEDFNILIGIKLQLVDMFDKSESIEGVLDNGVEFQKPISLDNGQKKTDKLIKIISKGTETFIVTTDSVYRVLAVPPRI